jgi:hypothetical protein
MLSTCGLCLGDPSDLIPASTYNRAGYWENRHFDDINDALLELMGAAWDYPATKSLAELEGSGDLLHLLDKAKILIDGFREHDCWGWKDPRTALTLPFWRQLIPDLKLIICVRNPIEVAISLRRRKPKKYTVGLLGWYVFDQISSILPRPDDERKRLSFRIWKAFNSIPLQNLPLISSGYVPAREALDRALKLRRRRPLPFRIGLELWYEYYKALLASSAPDKRLVVSYTKVLEDPTGELQRMLTFIGLDVADNEWKLLPELVLPSLRSHTFSLGELVDCGVEPRILQLYELLRKDAEAPAR